MRSSLASGAGPFVVVGSSLLPKEKMKNDRQAQRNAKNRKKAVAVGSASSASSRSPPRTKRWFRDTYVVKNKVKALKSFKKSVTRLEL